jgi:hypothetical protein
MSEQQLEESTPNQALQNTPERLMADFLTHDQAAAELQTGERTLDRWRRLGEGPPVTSAGRRILYRRSSVQGWLRRREGTSHDHR